jgi:hypothetical protein
MAADLRDVFVRKGDLVAAVARADQIGQGLGVLQVRDLFDRLLHGDPCGLLGINLALYRGIRDNVASLVEDHAFGIG